MQRHSKHRSGSIAIILLLAACFVALLVVGVVYLQRSARDEASEALLLHTVEQSDFVAFVTEPGDVASSSNVEVRCRVKSRGTPGTPIIKICDEGTNVEPGDFLLQLDDSVLQSDLLAQKIVVANDKALLIQAKSNLANAERTLREFDEGLYQQELELLESELFVAEEELRKSELALASTRRTAARGLLTELQVTAAEFAFEKAKKDVAAADRKVSVYKEFTRAKMIGEYKAEIDKEKANVEAATFTLELSEQKLKEIEEQIAFCQVTAPTAGQVIHANDRDDWGNGTDVMEEGTLIRENQVVVRLPDLQNMQVDVKINESHVNRIKLGQPAEIELDADPEKLLHGIVEEVAAYPFPIRWHGAPLEYGATVRIIDPPLSIRPGLRAKVKIYFEQQPKVLQVPLAAVIEHDQILYCLVREGNDWRTQRVELGSNNNTHVIIESGLADGDRVSLTPFRHIERSELPDATPAEIAARNRNKDVTVESASSSSPDHAAPAS